MTYFHISSGSSFLGDPGPAVAGFENDWSPEKGRWKEGLIVEETGTGMAEDSNLKESKREPNQFGARLEMNCYTLLPGIKIMQKSC